MKVVKFVISLVYFFLLVYAVFFIGRRRHQEARYVILNPVQGIAGQLKAFKLDEKGDALNYFSNLLGNIALLVPYTFILIVFYNYKNYRLVFLSAVLISICIEVLQYIFQVGVADINDVIFNSLGALAGVFIFSKFEKMKLQISRQ
ncbi:MAG: VanZ family protein [Bacteroidota bacterium]